MMQATKHLSNISWKLAFRTKSNKPNWCFHRFRLYTATDNTLVQARKLDGTVIDTQLFRTSGYSWGGGFEHSFLFDFSFNTPKDEIEIYIKGIGTSTFQQLYAVYGHAGSAVRYAEDPAASGMTNAELSYINFDLIPFKHGGVNDTTVFIYIENQGLTSIGGADQFYGKTLDISGNNLSSADIDQLVIGCSNNGRSNGYLKITGNAPRTSVSDAAWADLGAKSWTLIP